jgi:hypothetical protein
MFHSEGLIVQAQADKDYRLMLSAIDRARQALELTMKAVGMLQSDVAVTVNVEQMTTQRALDVLLSTISGEARQVQFLRIVNAFAESRDYELPLTIEASENGTEIRDQKALTA